MTRRPLMISKTLDRCIPIAVAISRWVQSLSFSTRQQHADVMTGQRRSHLRPRQQHVATLLAQKMETLPSFLRNSVAWDQDKEMTAHANFTIKTGIDVYFCDPHSPWQRGSNENINSLLRQYFPKGTDLSIYTQAELDTVADELNNHHDRYSTG